ncbi:MAG: SDR family oxidoreductase [Calditrichia bacterium]
MKKNSDYKSPFNDAQDDRYRILVTGASGYVGGRLVPLLLQEGYPVRCMVRNPAKLSGRSWQQAEITAGDVLKPETLAAALKDIDIAYYLVHSMSGSDDFEEMDIRAAANFAQAAANNRVKRIIYLGGLAKNTADMSPHLRSRQKVGEVLGQTGVPVTELRASIVIGSGSASFEIIRDLVRKLPVMITPKWVNSLCEPIAIRNVLNYLTGCINEPRTVGEILEIGGGEVLSYGEMMRQVAEITGRKLRIISVPVLTPKLSAYWLNLVTTVPMNIAFPLVEGLRNDTICSDHRIREWIPQELLSFRKAVRRALQREKSGSLDSRWTEAESGSLQATELKLEGRFLQDYRVLLTPESPETVFNKLRQIGGDTGWYYANWLWKLRGGMDRLIGGVGMRRGRRHPTDLRIGDAVDFWRVEAVDPPRYLKLRAEMKLPGTAWLEFNISKNPQGLTQFEQKAVFKPQKVFGKLYWYLTMPFHFFIFRNMAKRITEGNAQK